MDNKVPAWLYFALHDYSGKLKTNNPLEILANVLHKLKLHYEERKALGLGIVLESNNYDAHGTYGKCPCQDCCNVSRQELSEYENKTGSYVEPTSKEIICNLL